MTDSRTSAVDLLIVMASFIAAMAALTRLDVPYAGPLVVFISIALATWRLRRAGSGWAEIGMARPHRPLRLIGIALIIMVAAFLAGGIGNAIATQLLGLPAPSAASYGELHGNLPRLALLLLIAWSSAGFGEEMLFRGFILTRLETLLGASRTVLILAVVLQAALFGLAHYKQGPGGLVVTAMVGLAFGVAYARTRNLWPLILAHALVDTVSLTSLYAGAQ